METSKNQTPQTNLGWLYNKEYFSAVSVSSNGAGVSFRHLLSVTSKEDVKKIEVENEKIIAAKNKHLLGRVFSQQEFAIATASILSNKIGAEKGVLSFELESVGSGLLAGIGYQHEAGIKGEFKLGMSFDHATGLPFIPGSTIKGVLKSLLGNEAIAQHFLPALDISAEAAAKLVQHLEGKSDDDFSLGMYERDVFFDAFPIAAKGKLFAQDVLAPHSGGAFKNPVPLAFLKVNNGVKFLFQFKLSNSPIAANKKLELFRMLLAFNGIGAKTNVGYGELD